MLKLVNTTLQDMYERGVEVWNQPVMGAPELKLIFPKNILRVGDFPGLHFNLPACGCMMARKLS